MLVVITLRSFLLLKIKLLLLHIFDSLSCMHVVFSQSTVFKVQIFDLLIELSNFVDYFFVTHYEIKLLLKSMVFFIKEIDLVAQFLDGFFVSLLVILQV